RRPPVEHVRVDHRRPHIAVAEELLYRPDVVAVLEQMCGERVPDCMVRCGLGDAHLADPRCTARWITVSCKWWRRRSRVTGSKYVRVAGSTHCQGHSRRALGYFRPSACGTSTHPAPAPRSRSCCSRTRSR